MWIYVKDSFARGWKSAVTWWGFGTNMFLFLLGLFTYVVVQMPTIAEIINGEYIMLIGLFFLAVIITWVLFSIFELKTTTFAKLEIRKINGKSNVGLHLHLDERRDLNELSVQLRGRSFVLKNGDVSLPHFDPENNLFSDGLGATIGYEGDKVVRIADIQEGNIVFLLEEPEEVHLYESSGDRDYAVYDVSLRVKGKIEGKSIMPRRVDGRIEFWRDIQQFSIEVSKGDIRSFEKMVGFIKWDSSDT